MLKEGEKTSTTVQYVAQERKNQAVELSKEASFLNGVKILEIIEIDVGSSIYYLSR